ncbi:hypothetical protein GCM10028827_37830 [Mucilaginibacter myungsuensis]
MGMDVFIWRKSKVLQLAVQLFGRWFFVAQYRFDEQYHRADQEWCACPKAKCSDVIPSKKRMHYIDKSDPK